MPPILRIRPLWWTKNDLSPAKKNKKQFLLLNLLTPESDWYLTSPYNITPETHIEVMRIQEMITN